jgi:hypothetical protein
MIKDLNQMQQECIANSSFIGSIIYTLYLLFFSDLQGRLIRYYYAAVDQTQKSSACKGHRQCLPG